MNHFRRLRGLPNAADEVHVEPEAACHQQQDPAEAPDEDASALSLLASLRAASTMPAPWEADEEAPSPMLLPHGGLSPTLSPAVELPGVSSANDSEDFECPVDVAGDCEESGLAIW